MSSTTTDAAATLSAAAELAPDPNEVTADDKDAVMCASAPCTARTPLLPRCLLTNRPLVCVCSAALRAQLATKDEQIDALTKQVGMLNVKPGPKIVGVFHNEAGTIMRAVYEGTGKGTEAYFTKNPGGTSKKYLKAEDEDMWVFKDEADVLAAVAEHDIKMENLKASSPAK